MTAKRKQRPAAERAADEQTANGEAATERPAAARRSATGKRGGRTKRANAGRARISPRRMEANQRLLLELRALRDQLRELLHRYEIRVGGQLAELEQLVHGDAPTDVAGRPLTTRTALAMLEEIGGTRIKPKKGRPKDFGRLEALVDRLAAQAPPEH